MLESAWTEGWSVYGPYRLGEQIEGALGAFPPTASLLECIRGADDGGILAHGRQTHIKPHVG